MPGVGAEHLDWPPRNTPRTHTLLAEFFPDAVRQFDEYLGRMSFRGFLRHLREGPVCGIDLGQMHKDLRALTLHMLEAWFSAAQGCSAPRCARAARRGRSGAAR